MLLIGELSRRTGVSQRLLRYSAADVSDRVRRRALSTVPDATQLGETEFVAELRALESRYWHTHPFHQRLHRGELSKDEVRLWAANRW